MQCITVLMSGVVLLCLLEAVARASPFKNCKELYEAGYTTSGIYTIQPQAGQSPFEVVCAHSLPGGGWTVIQRRVCDGISFDRTIEQYKNGFGELGGDLWLGLNNIRSILQATPLHPFQLIIEVETLVGGGTQDYNIIYNTFNIGPSPEFMLTVQNPLYPGSTLPDAMYVHDGQKFSAGDLDQDSNPVVHCAQRYHSGWWHNTCEPPEEPVQLNGVCYPGGVLPPSSPYDDRILYPGIPPQDINSVMMAIKPM